MTLLMTALERYALRVLCNVVETARGDDDVDDRILGANAVRQYLLYLYACVDMVLLIAYIGANLQNYYNPARRRIYCFLSKRKLFIHYNKEMCFHNCRNGYDAMEYVSTWGLCSRDRLSCALHVWGGWVAGAIGMVQDIVYPETAVAKQHPL